MNRIEKIVAELLTRQITEKEAVQALESIVDEKIPKGAFEYHVENVATNADNDHILRVVSKYGSDKVMQAIKTNDRIYIMPKY